MAQLEDHLIEFQLQLSHLIKPCSEDHRNRIAVKIDDWESLAPFIGLEHLELEDIKEENRTIRGRRLALLRKWSQKHGREATYLKLINGLREINRRDLIEDILTIVKSSLQSQNQIESESYDNTRLHCSSWKIVLLTVIVFTAVFYTGIGWSSNTSGESIILSSHQELEIQKASEIPEYFPPSDLPSIFGPFVGRENDVNAIVAKIQQSGFIRTIHIHGPPAFGKSTLAIKVGYELVSLGIAVRYIDSLQLRQYTSPYSSLLSDDEPTALTKYIPRNEKWTFSTISSNVFVENLLNWAESLQNFTVLILDNCDSILNSHMRDTFIHLLNQLPNNKLKLLMTSQEQLMLLDGFESWQVKELNTEASKELLKNLVHNVSSEDSFALAESVGGCPLALKVIGMMVNISGHQFIPSLVSQLERSPIATLNEVSDKRARFKVVMDTAYNYLSEDLQTCSQYYVLLSWIV